MLRKKNLQEELLKYQFLANVNNKIYESSNHQEVKENDTIEKASNELNKELEQKEKEIANNSQDINQDLTFLEKASMLIGNKETFINIIHDIVSTLYIQERIKRKLFYPYLPEDYIQKENKEIANSIKQKLDPTASKLNTTIDKVLHNIENRVQERSNKYKNDTILKFNKGEEENQAKHLQKLIDIGKKNNANKKMLEDLIELKNKISRNNYPIVFNDEKAIISYNFNANDNDIKLPPRGYEQLQFLARVASNQPKDEIEAMLLKNGRFVGIALRVLKDFYQHALFKTITILTGRKFKLHPDDTEFKIIADKSWDNIEDGLIHGRYNTKRNNFGAWAFTVAKNATINEIKKITNLIFNDSIETLNAIEENDVHQISTTKQIHGVEGMYDNLEYDKEKNIYTYYFNNPSNLFNFIKAYTLKSPKTWFLFLTQESRKKLYNMGAIKSTKKFANVYDKQDNEKEYDKYAKKASGEERNKLFKQLAKFYQEKTKLSIKNKRLKETKELLNFLLPGNIKEYSKEKIEKAQQQIDNAFLRDLGKALYFYQAEFVKNMPFWTQIPPKEVRTAFKQYCKEQGYPNKSCNLIDDVKAKDVVSNPIFYQNNDNTQKLLSFSINNKTYDLDDYIYYKEVNAIGKKHGVPEYLKNVFYKQQEEQKKINPITYTFKDEDNFWNQVSKAIAFLNIKKEKKDARRTQYTHTVEYEKQIVNVFLNTLLNSPNLNNKQVSNYIINFFHKKPKITLNDKEGKTIFSGKFPLTLKELENSLYYRLICKKYNINEKDVNKAYNTLFFLTYQKYKKQLNNDKNYQKFLINIYNLHERAKEYIYGDTERQRNLKHISGLLSNLSGFNIQLEQQQINEIFKYLNKK